VDEGQHGEHQPGPDAEAQRAGGEQAEPRAEDGPCLSERLGAEEDQHQEQPAEGQQQAQELKAQGFAKALDNIFASAKNVDQKTMTLQYFDTLKSVGMSPSTKYIFPMEFTSMLDNFLGKDGGKK